MDSPTAPTSEHWKPCGAFTITNRMIDGADLSLRPDLLVACSRCGKPTLFRANLEENKRTGELRLGTIVKTESCPDCMEMDRQREELEKWKQDVDAVFPPTFNRTDPARLPQAQLEAAMSWTPTAERPGLLLHGPTGGGKTRIAILAARRLSEKKPKRDPAWDDLPWYRAIPVWLPCFEFSHQIQGRFAGDGNGPEWIDGLAARSIVILDDLGKGKLTERVQAELFGLLDTRFSYGKTTLITCNLAGDGLLQSFSADFGPPLVRRLREFCLPIGFKA